MPPLKYTQIARTGPPPLRSVAMETQGDGMNWLTSGPRSSAGEIDFAARHRAWVERDPSTAPRREPRHG